MITKFLFRVDAGPDIGLGHLQRCMSLATALSEMGAKSFFLTNKEDAVQNRLSLCGFSGNTLNSHDSWSADDLEQTFKVAAQQNCHVVVVDSDHEGAEYLGRLREAGLFVVAIEDLAPHAFPCQMVVNGDANARLLSYVTSSDETCLLLGPEYSVLGREFWKVPSRKIHGAVQNILVTLGGADPYNLMPRVLGLVDDLPGIFSVMAIIGPFFKNFEEVQVVAQHSKNPMRLVRSPELVRDLMLEADVAVSAGGQTLYELACVGCPTVAVQTASNQDGQVQVFAESGFLRAVGCAKDNGVVAAIRDAVISLLPDPQGRAAMSNVGQRLIDGQGALRVARTILEKMSKNRPQAV